MLKIQKVLIVCMLGMVSFIATGCDKKVEESKPSIVWVKPTGMVCEANGGEMSMYECQAQWKDAPKICKAFGARLPAFDELKSAMTECGGILNDTDRNENNQTYQKCREKLGFSDSWYWSSTERDSLNGACLHLETGYDVPYIKSSKFNIMCIDVNNSKN
ncbi:MAG: hypothetical protein KN64_11160 [Sulfurovum sp. AS07-7]|nr:MAG: hypothetical protein KN64_11160 [Sulfurovum sp. AS07-7]